MKRVKIDLNEERRVLVQCIASTSFLRQIIGVGHPQLFESPYSRTVAEWIWEYWETAKQSPGRDIEAIYIQRRSEIPDEEDLELIADFLTGLSRDWARVSNFNVPYAVEEAIRYFRRRSLSRLRDRIDETLESGEVDRGTQLVSEYDDVMRPLDLPVHLYRNAAEVAGAFLEEEERLFQFPNELGRALGPFVRGDFFAVLGAMKRGKSWWLLYTAFQAVNIGLTAVFYSLEMVKPRVLRRAWQMVEGQSRHSVSVGKPVFVRDGDNWIVEKETVALKGIDPSKIASRQSFYYRNLRGPDLRIQTYPAYSATVADIINHLDYLKDQEGFLPDVIVIDYADIIAPSDTSARERRHQLDDIWKRLRALAQERYCLVVTASQGTRATLKGDANTYDIAEDIRKAAHVTKMVALNQSPEDKARGVMRVRHLLERDGSLCPQEIVVLECPAMARPYLDARLANEVNLDYASYEKNNRDG